MLAEIKTRARTWMKMVKSFLLMSIGSVFEIDLMSFVLIF